MTDSAVTEAVTNDPVETVNIKGVELALVPEIMSNKMLDVIRAGTYEAAELAQIERIVQPGERIVELGAGIGLISIKAALTGDCESIACYEANPRLIPLIERNAALNGVEIAAINTVIDPAPAAKTIPFYVRRDFWASSLMPEPWGYEQEIQVPVLSFDEMRERHRPSMLIVDIEGAEEALFRGVALTGIKKIYIELHQQVIGRVGMKNLFDMLSARDFHYDMHHSAKNVVLFSHVLR